MDETEKNGLDRYHELQARAKGLGVETINVSTELLEAAIKAKLAQPSSEKPKPGITAEQAAEIQEKARFEFEIQEKFRLERQVQIDRAAIVTKARSRGISIDIPEKPTELELAKARLTLDMKKAEIRPSPETVAIESSKRGYYIFTNLEQDDAGHTINPGGKHVIDLFPDQIHVLSAFHIKFCRQKAVTPIYGRVAVPGLVPGPETVGRMKEECKRTGSKPRFSFEYLGEAPQDAPFGIVTDMKILDGLRQPVEELYQTA